MIRDSEKQHHAKNAAGKAAAQLIENGMRVGLGTGSTAKYFIAHLIERCRQGLQIKAVATSTDSYEMALKGGIPMLNIDEVTSIDMTVDGADEIDPKKQMIKGGGGALLREKIIAYMSEEMVVIVDEGKRVETLAGKILPIEVVPFGHKATSNHLRELGFNGLFREKANKLFVTENNNYILDVKLPQSSFDALETEKIISKIPGVVTTGLFINMAGRVITGLTNGKIEIQN